MDINKTKTEQPYDLSEESGKRTGSGIAERNRLEEDDDVKEMTGTGRSAARGDEESGENRVATSIDDE